VRTVVRACALVREAVIDVLKATLERGDPSLAQLRTVRLGEQHASRFGEVSCRVRMRVHGCVCCAGRLALTSSLSITSSLRISSSSRSSAVSSTG
jgi:hypothetical protein